MNFEPIAHIRTDFPSKFGIPRQSSLVPSLRARIVMEPQFRSREAFTALEGCTHIWLLWVFSETLGRAWSPTVRPPRLGGNRRVGVFATRSPFRPNPIGLSAVQLQRIEFDSALGPVLHVCGADLMDGTPILDIKPYLAYADSIPSARVEYLSQAGEPQLEVVFCAAAEAELSAEEKDILCSVLERDPRPSFQDDPDRIYGMAFRDRNIRFRVAGGVLTVLSASADFSL